MLFFDALYLSNEMTPMTEESVEEHTINSTDIMVDHLMDQQLPKHFFIQVDALGYPNVPHLLSVAFDLGGVCSKGIFHVIIGESTHRQLVVEVQLVVLLEFLFQEFFCYFHCLCSCLKNSYILLNVPAHLVHFKALYSKQSVLSFIYTRLLTSIISDV